jgi:hypothetical protein
MKEILSLLGIDYIQGIRKIKTRNARRVLDRKGNDVVDKTVQNYDLATHFAHETLEEEADQIVLKSSLIDRITFLRQCFSESEIQADSFLDLGDPSGIFLKSLGKDGISANISRDAVNNCRINGMDAIQCDLNHLPFRDSAIDHIFLFQTLEHMADPISVLKKLHSISGKSLTISIPHVKKTLIHRYNYQPHWRIYEHHIFEFSDEDVKKIITHSGFTLEKMEHAVMIDEKYSGLPDRLIMYLYTRVMRRETNNPEYYTIADDLFDGSFKQFSMIHLRKKDV